MTGEQTGSWAERPHKDYSNAEAIDIIHQVANFYVGTRHPMDYGTGEEYTSMEVHTLKYIADHPGITVTELARDYGKTKGAISQILKKIESKGLINREAASGGDNRFFLYPTDKGKELDLLHRQYDSMRQSETMDRVRAYFTQDEIDLAFQVLETWLDIRRDVQQERMARRKQKQREERNNTL